MDSVEDLKDLKWKTILDVKIEENEDHDCLEITFTDGWVAKFYTLADFGQYISIYSEYSHANVNE